MKKKRRWIRTRHSVIKKILSPFVTPYVCRCYGCSVERFVPDGRNYLILVNHQTDADQFIVNAVFPFPLYFVAMEDLLSRGIVSRIIEWCAAPIPILKGVSDAGAVKKCMYAAREGGNIVLFPEGNRTYSGRTCYIGPQIAKFIKLMKLPVLILRIEGGYGIKPRWSDSLRNGSMRAGVRRIIEQDEYSRLDNSELYDIIVRELYVDDTMSAELYTGERLAEGLERVLYYCPVCGLAEYRTDGDIITCTGCGRTMKLLPDQTLKASDSAAVSLSHFYDEQEKYIGNLDTDRFSERPAFTDTVDMFRVVLYRRKELLSADTQMRLFTDRIVLGSDSEAVTRAFDDIRAMACVADHKLNIYTDDDVYQITGDTHFNALKYCNFYYHYTYVKKGNNNGEFQFLGL